MLTFISSRLRSLIVLFPLFISAYSQALTIEENAPGFCSYDGSIQSTHVGAANNSYVNLSNDAGKGITWAVQASQAGNYTVQFRYANWGSQAALAAAIRINGVVIAHALPFPKTGAWSNWANSAAFTVALNSGNNTIRLETTVASEFANIDSLTINGTDLAAGACAGAGTPKSPNGGVITQPQAPVLAATPSPSTGMDMSRAMPAEFDVNNSGQATYKIPVVTAPGTAGLVPNVSLNYSSGGGNGLLGLGWSLSAYGSISRCRQTEGVDGVAKPITWTGEDRFCLNGDRLLLASGAYGSAGSTYKTEIDSFSRITAVGGTSGHPDYFTVEYKDGITETYGNTTDSNNSKNQLSASNSNTVLDWALSKRSDSAGNKIVYNYVKDSDGQRIDTIDYAFGATSTRGAYLQLNYESRNDPISGYVAGHAYKTGKRLSGVKSYNGTNEIRNYSITYNQGSAYTTNDKLSRINKIQECVSSVCSPATEFEWELIYNDIYSEPESSFLLTGGIGLPGTKAQSQILADINGDNIKDIVWVDANRKLRYAISRQEDNIIQYTNGVFSDSGGAEFSIHWSFGSRLQTVDFNADGRDDLAIRIGDKVFLSAPTADGKWALTQVPFASIVGSNSQYADFNGDGLADVIEWRMETSGVGNWTFEGHGTVRYLQKGSGSPTSNNLYEFSEPEVLSNFVVYCERYQNCIYGEDSIPAYILSVDADFDGDGKTDVLAADFTGIDCTTEMADVTGEECKNRTYQLSARINKIVNGQPTLIKYGGAQLVSSDSVLAWDPEAFRTTKAIDLNNDGLSDLIYGAGPQLRARLNTGAGFSDYQIINVTGNDLKDFPTFSDMNGDGYKDIVWVDNGTNIPTNGSTSVSVKVKYWNPGVNAFETGSTILFTENKYFGNYNFLRDMGGYQIWNTTNQYPNNRPLLIDFNGDGYDDWIKVPARDTGSVSVKLNSQTRAAGNKVVAIKNGLNESKNISYERINKTAHYSRLSGINTSSTTEEKCEDVIQTYADDTQYSEYLCWSETTNTVNSANFYQAINNPWYELTSEEQSLHPASPTLEAFGPMSVVTDVDVTAPSSNKINPQQIDSLSTAKFSYYYAHAKMQAGGRGFLGFKNFTVVNRETGIRTETEYRQDWPFIGQARKIKSFTSSGHKLSEQENIWGLVNCYDAAGNANASCVSNMSSQVAASGTGALDAVKPFLRKTTSKTYALKDNGITQGDLLSTSIETNRYDTNGNVLDAKKITSSDLGLPTLTKATTNVYSYSGNSWSMQQGRLERLSVTSNDSRYGNITRTSAFNYYQSGTEIGLLKTEIVEPDNPDFTVATIHTYSMGNRISSSTTADGQTRSAEVEYDTLGRYVDKTYEFFTNGVDVNTPIKYLVNQVVTRDKYGTPTLSRQHYSSTAFVSYKTATTAFGTPYFSAASTGEFTETQAGIGTDTYGVCPSDTKTWSTARTAGGAVAIQCLDLLGRVRRAGNLGFNGSNWNLVDTEYDKLGRVIRSSAPYASDTSNRYWTSYSYDILGRTTETRTPYKNTHVATTTHYENLNVVITNPKNQLRVEKRDLAGQVVEVVDPNNGTTTFAYDARGNMREMKDPAQNTTTIGYDLRDRKISMSDPDKGNWIYQYNRFNELTCQRDGKNQFIIMTYDIRGRMVSRNERSSGTCDSTVISSATYWVYDKASNGLGQLESVYTTPANDPTFRQRLKYDSRGRLSTKETSFLGHLDAPTTHHEKITYDQYNRIHQQFDAAREVSSFESNGFQHIYNDRGYLHKVVDATSYNGSQQAYYTVQNQDARGNVISAVYGNGVTQAAAYEPETGLAASLRASRPYPFSLLQDIHFEWDEVSNLSSRHERGTADELAPRNIYESFGYDNLNRLNSWTSSGDFTASESVTYDSIDNIRSKNGRSYLYGKECYTTLNAGPHAVCNADDYTYRYDNNGNLTEDGRGRSLQYTRDDLASQIVFGSHKTQFWYDPNRSRYKRVDTSTNQQTTTLYIGSVEKVYYPDGSLEWKRNVAGVGQITQKLNNQGVIVGEAQRYFIKDHLGSISLITDEIGAVEQAFYFDPWGMSRKVITANGVKKWQEDQVKYRLSSRPITTRGFTGHEHLSEVDFIHMNGRIYDARIGRFIQADPIIQNPLRVQSLNRYSYVWNNPLNATDPSGFECVDVGHHDKKCTSDKKDEKPVEEVEVTGKKENRPKPGVILTFLSGSISGSSFSGYAISGQGITAFVSEDMVNKYTGGDTKNISQKVLDKIIAGAAASNSLAAASDAALEAMGDVGGFENIEGNPFLGAVAVLIEQGTMGIVFGNTSILSLRTTPQIEANKAAAMEGKAGKLLNAVAIVGMVRGGFLKRLPKAVDFGSAKLLRQHWKKHGGEWGSPMTQEQYLARAKKFLSGAPDAKTMQYQRFDGSIVRYSSRTGEFGVAGADGTISTLFRPAMTKKGGDGLEYFMNDRLLNVGH